MQMIDTTDLAALGVYPYPIDGIGPSASAMREVAGAMTKLPPRYLRPWRAAGGQVDIIPGWNAAKHPKFLGNPAAAGYTRHTFSAVAADDPDLRRTVLHELGHAVDHALGDPSGKIAWLKIWQRDREAGRVPPFANQHRMANEYFAECFANLWSGNGVYVTEAASNYIAFELVPSATP
jgi:hypothetical protein